jgi:hypothetical protein
MTPLGHHDYLAACIPLLSVLAFLAILRNRLAELNRRATTWQLLLYIAMLVSAAGTVSPVFDDNARLLSAGAFFVLLLIIVFLGGPEKTLRH